MIVLIPLLLFGVPAVGFWVGLHLWYKNKKTNPGPQRAPVTAYLVQYFPWRRPQRIIFDYPLPSGQWQRVDRTVFFNPAGSSMEPGTPFTVYVNPQQPLDVSLGASNTSNGVPVFLGLAAGMFTVMTLVGVLLFSAF